MTITDLGTTCSSTTIPLTVNNNLSVIFIFFYLLPVCGSIPVCTGRPLLVAGGRLPPRPLPTSSRLFALPGAGLYFKPEEEGVRKLL